MGFMPARVTRVGIASRIPLPRKRTASRVVFVPTRGTRVPYDLLRANQPWISFRKPSRPGHHDLAILIFLLSHTILPLLPLARKYGILPRLYELVVPTDSRFRSIAFLAVAKSLLGLLRPSTSTFSLIGS